MPTIHAIIDETPYITDLQKEFYKTILAARKERIIDYSFQLLQSRRHQVGINKGGKLKHRNDTAR